MASISIAHVDQIKLIADIASQRLVLDKQLEELKPSLPQLSYDEWCRQTFPDDEWDSPFHQFVMPEVEKLSEPLSEDTPDNLIVVIPPRHTKTTTITIRYSAYRIIMNPKIRVVVCSYSQDLADLLSEAIRNIVKQFIPLSRTVNRVKEWQTAMGGGVKAVGRGAGLAGYGADLLMMDDIIKDDAEARSDAVREAAWRWFTRVAIQRREPGARMVLIGTRWHEDDVIGRLLSAAEEVSSTWKYLRLPALAEENDPVGREVGEPLWPERVTLKSIQQVKILDPGAYWTQYQGLPTAGELVTFKRDWWAGERNRFNILVKQKPVARALYFDTAEEVNDASAYTVCTALELHMSAFTGYELRLVDVIRKKVLFPELVELIEEAAILHNQDRMLRRIWIEYASSGRQAYQTIKKQSPRWIAEMTRRDNPVGSKEDRAAVASSWCNVNMVKLPYPDPAVPWLHEFETEIYTFPAGAFKDQVDAFSGGINKFRPELEVGFQRRLNEAA